MLCGGLKTCYIFAKYLRSVGRLQVPLGRPPDPRYPVLQAILGTGERIAQEHIIPGVYRRRATDNSHVALGKTMIYI